MITEVQDFAGTDVTVGLSRRTDPTTSREAAESVNVTARENVVLQTLMRYGACSMEDVVDITGIPWASLTPRFRPLANKGLIKDSGKRVKSRSGRNVIVWTLTNKPS